MDNEVLSDDALIRKILTVFSQKGLENVYGRAKNRLSPL